MTWVNISTTLALAVAIIVFLQGWSILRRPDKTEAITILGFLTIVLAVLGMIFEILYISTGIVISPEFLVLLVQGGPPDIFFSILLLGLSFFLSFAWYVLRLKAGREPNKFWVFIGAIALGVSAIYIGRKRIPVDFDAPQVYVYELWPVLLIFIVMVFFTSINWTKKRWLDEFRALFSQSITLVNQYRFMLVALGILIAGLGIMIYDFELPGPALGIIIILAGWAALTEIITDGALQSLSLAIKNGQGLALNGILQRIRDRTTRKSDNTGTSTGSVWSTILKLLLLFFLLVFFNDALNFGKTITQSFQAIGFEEDPTLADSINERLINNLAQLNQQFQPDVILLNGAGERNDVNFIRARDADSAIDAIAANSGSVELGSINIPLNALVSPIRAYSRPLFKVRVVNGSFLSDGGDYILLATASNGGTWVARAKGDQPGQAIPGLVEELAFKILISEPGLNGYGITRDWEAFQSFQEGMQDIQKYESKDDDEALTKAIQSFQDSIHIDHRFALAYYRLGLALQQNQQPWQAEDALRMGLFLNPDSTSLKNALAYHLYFYDSYAPKYPAVIPFPEASENQVKKNEARRLWHQIISLPFAQVALADLVSAYSGLCWDATESIPIDGSRSTIKGLSGLAYFYCYRSQNLLERLPAALQTLEQIHQAKADNWNNLGRITAAQSPSEELKGWNCYGFVLADDGTEMGQYYRVSRAALRYYEKAIATEPQNTYFQCNTAILDKLLGRPARMDKLEQNAQAHYELGTQYLHQARLSDTESPSPYYKTAIQEFQEAIDIDPMHHEAHNEYAYTYWVFRLHWPDESLKTLGIDPFESLAEHYARKAVRLAKIQQDDYLEIIYTSTLAEVLLTKGKFKEAEWILRELFEGKKAKVPESYKFDEVRWELAQASLCLSKTDPDAEVQEKMKNQATRYLKIIRENEKKIEARLFSKPGTNYLTTYEFPFCMPK